MSVVVFRGCGGVVVLYREGPVGRLRAEQNQAEEKGGDSHSSPHPHAEHNTQQTAHHVSLFYICTHLEGVDGRVQLPLRVRPDAVQVHARQVAPADRNGYGHV